MNTAWPAAELPPRRLDALRPGRRMPFTRQVLLLQVAVVFVVGAVAVVAAGLIMRDSLTRQYEERALAVARSVASDSTLPGLVVADRQAEVQTFAERERLATGALFVVITDERGIRLSHPNPAMIGKRVSTDPTAALAGQEVAVLEQGTLGLSARGKVPLRGADGRIVGEVSVGFAASEIDSRLHRLLLLAIPVLLGAVAIGAALSWLLTRRFKRLTFGLEPDDMADLVREREAVLFGISEGVLAVDPHGTVTMANNEARRLLGAEVVQGASLASLPLPDRLREAFAREEDGDVIAVAGSRVIVATHRRVSADGADLGRVMTLRDRSEMESLTDELAAVRSMTSALRAQRHEFANRMHTILGLLETDSAKDAAEYLRASTGMTPATRFGESTAVASSTIRSFLAGKVAEAAEVGVALELSEESWLPHKLVAPVEVITVLGNLVDNAVAAASSSTIRPALVTVDLLADDTTLVISVSNTGDGIDTDRLEAIFGEGVSSRGSGRGLGLAISRQTARGLGGDVSVTAAGGAGSRTVFVAQLPQVLDAEAREPARADPGSSTKVRNP